MGFNAKGEQVIPDDGDIVGQGTDEGSIYDEFIDDDNEIEDEEIIVDEDEKDEDKEPEVRHRENRLEKRMEEIEARRKEIEAKNNVLNQRLFDVEKGQALTEVTSNSEILAQQIKTAEEKKEVYMEDGNFSAVTEIDRDLGELRNKEKDNRDRKARVEQAEYVPEVSEEPASTIPEAQQQWMDDNKWFNRVPGKTAYVNETFDEIVAEGFAADDPKTYDELNKRISNNSDKTYAKKTKRNEAAPPPGDSEVGDGPTNTRRKSALTNADLVKMRKWGLDTNSKEARAEWLRNKRKAEAEYN